MTTILILLPLAKGGGLSIEAMFASVSIALMFLFVSHFVIRTKERTRTEQFETVAKDMHFEFIPKGDPALLEILRGFQRFAACDNGQIKNLLRSKTEKLEVTVRCADRAFGPHAIRHLPNLLFGRTA